MAWKGNRKTINVAVSVDVHERALNYADKKCKGQKLGRFIEEAIKHYCKYLDSL